MNVRREGKRAARRSWTSGAQSELARDDYEGRRLVEFRARLLFTRIGDHELKELWETRRAQSDAVRQGRKGIPTRAEQQARMKTAGRLFERSGELMREIDQASTGE